MQHDVHCSSTHRSDAARNIVAPNTVPEDVTGKGESIVFLCSLTHTNYKHAIRMDRTIGPEAIEEVLRNFDRRKDAEKRADASTEALNIASAIGTETPMTVLIDIRQCICELTAVLRTSNEDAAAREEASARRHNETLAFMSEMNDSLRKGHVTSHAPTSMRTSPSVNSKQEQREYFYGGDKLSTKNAVAGCVLMQVYNVAVREMSGSSYQQMDATPMELKHWSSLVSIVVEADSNITSTKGKLVLPKQTSSESITASELVASTVEGRNTLCKLEHLRTLQEECPSIIAVISEVRERIIACPGLLSPSRFRCLASISFPLVTRDGTLNMSSVDSRKGVTKVILDVISSLNIPQKKQYAMKVLRDNTKPLVAAKEVEKSKGDVSLV